MDDYSIKNTTKQQRIELIRSWTPVDEVMDENDVDMWEMYRDYIDGKKEIAECNQAFQAQYILEEDDSVEEVAETNDDEKLVEVKVDSKTVFDGVILHVELDNIKLPNGADATREVIRHVGAACVIPVTDEGKVIMEKQFRYPVSKVMLEIPAGKLNSKEEDRLEAAKRELKEETGYSADEWIDLGIYYPAAAYSDEKISMYLAKGLHKGNQKLDEDEFLDVYEIPLSDLVEDVMSGKITDGKTQVAILKAARALNR